MVSIVQKRFGGCPYHFVRRMFKEFDVLLMPYSYLLSEKIRKVLEIQLEGIILILDEAHNCEELAE